MSKSHIAVRATLANGYSSLSSGLLAGDDDCDDDDAVDIDDDHHDFRLFGKLVSRNSTPCISSDFRSKWVHTK